MIRINITKKGNALGFTSAGETVIGYYRPKATCWRIAVAMPESESERQTDERNRNFPSKAEAIMYARTIIDLAVTQQKAWWAL